MSSCKRTVFIWVKTLGGLPEHAGNAGHCGWMLARLSSTLLLLTLTDSCSGGNEPTPSCMELNTEHI